LYRIGDALFVLTYYILRWRRRLASANLARAFPEKDDAERAAILKQSYRNLGDLIAEIIWSYGATPEEMKRRVTVENPEVINNETRAGRSVLLMTAHFCNWEWQVLAGNTVLDRPMFPVYKPQRVAMMDRFLRDARGRFGGTPIPHKTLTRELIRRRSEAQVYAMVADQTPTVDEPIVFVEMYRESRGRYRMRVSMLSTPPYDRAEGAQVIERYARALENEIRTSPADWLWIHRKWKYPKPVAG
jgi:KDO2-lipid IV(A) lauroyltransferase